MARIPAAELSAADTLSAPLLPALATSSTVMEIVSPDEVRVTRGVRAYRVRGLARNLSAESLKITLRVSAGDHLHVDTLDLYQARSRSAFIKAAAVELGVSESARSSTTARHPSTGRTRRGSRDP